MKQQPVLIALGLLIGLSIGYVLGTRHLDSRYNDPAYVSNFSKRSAAANSRNPAKVAGQPDIPLNAEDAEHLLTTWATNENPRLDPAIIRKCLVLWSESDPYSVLEFIARDLSANLRDDAFAFPLAVIGRKNPHAVVEWLRARPSASDQIAIASFTVELLTKSSPRMALTIAENLPLNLSILKQTLLFGSLADLNPSEAKAAFARLPANRRQAMALAVGRGLARNDPRTALAWCLSLEGTPESGNAMQGVVAELAQNLGDELALEAIDQLRPPQESLDTIMRTLRWDAPETTLAILPTTTSASLAARFIEEDFTATPDEIVALARTGTPPVNADLALSAAWRDWQNSQRETTNTLLAGLGDPQPRASLEPVKLSDLAAADSVTFLERLAPTPATPSERETIKEALLQLPPAQAAQWAATNPHLLSPELTAQTIASYYKQDASAASAWALNLPTGEGQDQALAAVSVASIQEGDFSNAATSIAAISNPQHRTGAQYRSFSTLYHKDRGTARAWLAAQPVPPAIRANWETLANSGITPE